MADTWGDIISRNYKAGLELGNDFVSSRFASKADALRSTYEERAKAEGKQLQDYLPDLESELRTLAADTGATRRNLTDKSGAALDMGAMGRIRQDVLRGGEQRAGAQMMGGQQAEARYTRAGALASTGENFDDAQKQQIAGRTIAATSSAVGADGKYDAQKGALGMAKVGAEFGNAEGAAGQTEQADTFRMKSGAAKASQLYNLVSNGGPIDNDQFVGLWEGIKEDLPEYKNVDLRLEGGKIYIYENGKNTGDLDPQEAAQLLQTAIKAPGQTIQDSMNAQIKAVEDQKTARGDVDKKILDAQIEVVKKLEAAKIPSSMANAFIAAQKAVSSASGGSLQFKEIGDEPGKFIVTANGTQYVVKTNAPVGGLLGAGGATDDVQVFDLNGTSLPPDTLNKIGLGKGGDATSAIIALSVEQAKAGTDLNVKVMNEQLNLLNSIGAAYGGSQRPSSGGGARGMGALPSETQNYVKKITAAVGEVPAGLSNREKAEHIQKAVIQQESGGDPNAVSVKGAKGLMQLMPDTSRAPGYGVKPLQNDSPEENVRFGTDYLTAMLDEYGGDIPTALAAYNAGPGTVDKWLGGDKGGSKPKGALNTATAATTPPGTTKPEMVDTAVAQSAPAQQTKVPGRRRAAITGDAVAKQGSDLESVRIEFDKRRALLNEFDKDQGTKMGYVPGASRESAGSTQPTNLSAEAAAVRKRLVADLAKYQQDMVAMTAEVRADTAALRDRGGDQKKQALYAKYGGSADFYNRAGHGGSK